MLPGFPLGDGGITRLYDVSPDGRQILVHALDAEGKSRLWLAPVNRRTAPRPIPNAEGDGPVFSPTGEIYFRKREGTYGYAYRIQPDGSGLTKVLEYPVIITEGVSPDGKWLIVYARYTRPGEEPVGATMALPFGGGAGVRLFGPSGANPVKWSPDGRLLFLSTVASSYSGTVGKTLVVPLAAGRLWPELPPHGYAGTRTSRSFQVCVRSTRRTQHPVLRPTCTPSRASGFSETFIAYRCHDRASGTLKW